MSIRTVRTDDEHEKFLARVTRRTGAAVSDALKRGLAPPDSELDRTPARPAFGIFAELDLGPGGHAAGPAAQSRETVRRVLWLQAQGEVLIVIDTGPSSRRSIPSTPIMPVVAPQKELAPAESRRHAMAFRFRTAANPSKRRSALARRAYDLQKSRWLMQNGIAQRPTLDTAVPWCSKNIALKGPRHLDERVQ
jgi:hypothetical protein